MSRPLKILICGVNWLGDSIMSMPAIQMFRRRNPDALITILVKPKLAALWKMHSAPNEILTLEEGFKGTREIIRTLKSRQFDRAYILPNSFRSVWIPFCARVPERIGMPGHFRKSLLTELVITNSALHQAYEYRDILLDKKEELELPCLTIPAQALDNARQKLGMLPGPVIGFIPGAARGPSKRWPVGHFMELAEKLLNRAGSLVLFGAEQEKVLCDPIAERWKDRVLNLAGQTSLIEWAALLKQCDVVVCNDSGGMHLAAAVGVPVVALYGMTDPSKTGPLGSHNRVLQESTIRSRDIKRSLEEAEKSLAAIRPEKVYETVQEFLKANAK